MNRPTRRAAWISDGWFDLALALVVGGVTLTSASVIGLSQPEPRLPDAAALTGLCLGSAALVVRRRYPVGVLLLTHATALLYVFGNDPKGPNFLPMLVASASAGWMGRRLTVWAILAADFVVFPWLPYLLGVEPMPTSQALGGLAGWLLVWAFLAELLHIRQQRQARAAQEDARRRAEAERLRIARELHDVLGHHLSLISVQSGVALHLIDQHPEQARLALAVIKDTSRDALNELRSVLDVLRQFPEAPPRSPTSGLAHLNDLVSRASDAGLRVQTEVIGDLEGLPPGIDLAAFRILQEALTNVLRHAGQTAAHIRVARLPTELTVRIDNEASHTARDEIDSGQGIRGMQERARALGGEVEAGPRPDGGFRVQARLPLPAGPHISMGDHP